ncbi:MAG: tRNA (guanosine(37)-N1)-methyltransferase TrmD [Bdellovibrionaceae bacterium]|nr:tRNA (guanosine(37)-N1)-methyltransferase TrmD [Pseudobdellovibrionaceae bacterium]|tara:strand:- start:899 stop:1594 length:696 start_codon:yes stop_codon:yes gene_type:complete
MEIHILTLFPEVLSPFLNSSLLFKAQSAGLLKFHLHQIRDHGVGKHQRVDHEPYGGGPGMLMRVDVLHSVWKSITQVDHKKDSVYQTLLMSPQGKTLNQDHVRNYALSDQKQYILVCGHYEGVDQRFIDLCVDEEVSVGDYVLTGGELASLVWIDSVSRWIPKVIGNNDSVSQDSFEGNRLKAPQYTRPETFLEMDVPSVLLSGHHQNIQKWRDAKSYEQTLEKRPDLLKK